MNACSSIVGRVPKKELYVGFWDALRPGGVLLGFEKLLSLEFVPVIVLLGDPRVDPFSLFSCRMARGHEETSTSQVDVGGGLARSHPLQATLLLLCPWRS